MLTFSNKRGLVDFLVPLIFGVVLILILMLLYYLAGITGQMDIAKGYEESEQLQQKTTNARDVFDSMWIIFFFGTIFAIGIAAFLLRTQPIFLLGLWLLINVLILVASKLGEVIIALSEKGLFAKVTSGFGMSLYIFEHYAFFFFIMNTIIIAVIYGVGRLSEG